MDAPKSLADQFREIEQSYPPVSEDPDIQRLDRALAMLNQELKRLGPATVNKREGKI